MGKKGRPPKVRYIEEMPKVKMFSPRGKAGRPDEIVLTLDQYEALKLADLEGLSQEEAAKSMQISRSSFGRIIREARKRMADAIVNGKIIKIEMDSQIGVRHLDAKMDYRTDNQRMILDNLEKFEQESERKINQLQEEEQLETDQ